MPTLTSDMAHIIAAGTGNGDDGSKTLPNHRHELYSQELAKGYSAEKAYIAAGYRPSKANSHTLRNKKDIQARVAHLLAERERLHGQSTAKAIESTALTKAWVIENLRENALKALGKMPVNVMITEGQPPVMEYQYHPTGANRALELLGREMQMFIERVEVGDPGAWARMTDTELDQDLIDQAGNLGIPKQALAGLLTWEPPVEPDDEGEAK